MNPEMTDTLVCVAQPTKTQIIHVQTEADYYFHQRNPRHINYHNSITRTTT